MATINYNGMELDVFTSDKPVIFDTPRRCVTITINNNGEKKAYKENLLMAYIPERDFPAILENDAFKCVALLPEKPAPRRATNRELAKWLAQGNGEWRYGESDRVHSNIGFGYDGNKENNTLDEKVMIRKWDDAEWHEPTVDYMGIETTKKEE